MIPFVKKGKILGEYTFEEQSEKKKEGRHQEGERRAYKTHRKREGSLIPEIL